MTGSVRSIATFVLANKVEFKSTQSKLCIFGLFTVQAEPILEMSSQGRRTCFALLNSGILLSKLCLLCAISAECVNQLFVLVSK